MSQSLEISGLTKSFGGLSVVRGVSFQLSKPGIYAMVGPNGAGKTTVLDIISGFTIADTGIVRHNAQRIDRLPPWKIAGRGIGRLFQEPRVFANMTVLENILVGMNGSKDSPLQIPAAWLSRITDYKRLRASALRSLEDVGLSVNHEELAGSLSYGQQRLLSIARMLATGNTILLMDEPASGVHPGLLDIIMNILGRLRKEGYLILLVEHNLPFVQSVADQVFFMDAGQVTHVGSPEQVFNDDQVRRTYIC